MPDSKQVIFDIERCICHVPDACKDCSHYQKGEAAIDCMEILLADALALLREQELVETDGDNCGECGYPLHRINYDGPDKGIRHEWFRFCPSCGRAVKWE